MNTNRKNDYIDKQELHDQIRFYYEKDDASVKNGGGRIEMPNKLGNMFIDIADHLMGASRFSGYEYNDEMKSDCLSKMVDTIYHKKFKLFGDKKVPKLVSHTIKGYRFPEMELKPNQKFVLLDCDDKYTTHVFEEQYGFVATKYNETIDYDEKFYFNTNKECGEFVDEHKCDSHTKIKMRTIDGGIAFNKVESIKPMALIPDEESTITIDCADTIRVEYNGKRRLVEEAIYFDCEGQIKAEQQNNAFGYLSLICTREAQHDINGENRAKETLRRYQEQEESIFYSEHPDMKPQRSGDDTYCSWEE